MTVSMTPNAVRLRERRKSKPHVCRSCKGPVPPEFFICDGCTHPEHAKRRVAGKRDRAAEAARIAASVELSEHGQALEAAVARLEAAAARYAAHAQRLVRFVADGEAGITRIETKRLRATAIAGAGTGNEMESLR